MLLIKPYVEDNLNKFNLTQQEDYRYRSGDYKIKDLKKKIDEVFSEIQTKVNTLKQESPRTGNLNESFFNPATLSDEDKQSLFKKNKALRAIEITSLFVIIIGLLVASIPGLFVTMFYITHRNRIPRTPENIALASKMLNIYLKSMAVVLVGALFNYLSTLPDVKEKCRVLQSGNFSYFMERY